MPARKIENLSVSEKAELLDAVWESLEADALSLTDAQRAELDHRIERHDPLFLQVDSLSFHLVQILPVTSLSMIDLRSRRSNKFLKLPHKMLHVSKAICAVLNS